MVALVAADRSQIEVFCLVYAPAPVKQPSVGDHCLHRVRVCQEAALERRLAEPISPNGKQDAIASKHLGVPGVQADHSPQQPSVIKLWQEMDFFKIFL